MRDPRGLGDSHNPDTGYDLDQVAADVHGFQVASGLIEAGGIDAVSHDIAPWVA